MHIYAPSFLPVPEPKSVHSLKSQTVAQSPTKQPGHMSQLSITRGGQDLGHPIRLQYCQLGAQYSIIMDFVIKCRDSRIDRAITAVAELLGYGSLCPRPKEAIMLFCLAGILLYASGSATCCPQLVISCTAGRGEQSLAFFAPLWRE